MPDEHFSPEEVRELRAYAAEHMRRESLPALQLALAHGQHRLALSFGCRDATRFCVYSISKPIFASAVWRLADAEGFDLSTSVAKLVPDLRSCPVGSVRLSDVMSHMGGFPNATADLHLPRDSLRVRRPSLSGSWNGSREAASSTTGCRRTGCWRRS